MRHIIGGFTVNIHSDTSRSAGFAVALIAMLACLVPIAASSSDATSSVNRSAVAEETDDPPTLFLVYTEDESFEDQILDHLEASPGDLPVAQALVDNLIEQSDAGEDLNLSTDDDTLREQRADLAATAAALSAPGKAKTQNPVHRDALAPEPLSGAQLSDYPRRGHAIYQNFSWTLKTIVAAHVCSDGCGEDTDRVTVTWIVDPGRTTDRFQYTAIYSPKSPHPAFDDIYATVGAWAFGGVIADRNVGDAGARDGSGSGDAYLSHRSLAGEPLADLIRLHAEFRPTLMPQYDRARTAFAECGTGPDHPECLY